MWQKNLNDFNQVVALGGGHGLGRVLSSLSFLGLRLTGVVATTDDGGSTGRLRQSQGCIAWGDLRNCINQLVTDPSIGSLLFEYRFSGRGELAGHNLGNLMLLALDNLCVRPLDAIKLISDMLKIEPQLLPMSEYPTDLRAHLVDGQVIDGEVEIDQLASVPLSLSLAPAVPATAEAVQAIERADLILLSPGSFLTSVMPPLLLDELVEAINASRAPLLFISNLIPEQGPVQHMTLAEQCHWLERRVGRGRLDAIIAAPSMHSGDLMPWRDRLWQADLGESDLPHRHDRLKLRLALEKVLASSAQTRSQPR
ncbi:MAG: gluconeogenesis factor YvcK family protein [Aeromonas sp.]